MAHEVPGLGGKREEGIWRERVPRRRRVALMSWKRSGGWSLRELGVGVRLCRTGWIPDGGVEWKVEPGGGNIYGGLWGSSRALATELIA